MIRAHGLDTYWGEGVLNLKPNQFDFIYLKAAHFASNYLQTSAGKIRSVTRQNFEESAKIDMRGAYSYPSSNNQLYHWLRQADTYLEAVRYAEDVMRIPVHFDVLDIESANNTVYIGKQWTYPRGFGSMLYEMANYIQAERKKPLFLYFDLSTYFECFTQYGYKWQDKYPFIVANPLKYSKDTYDKVLAGEINPILGYGVWTWFIWQWTWTYPTTGWMPESTAADHNVTNCTLDDLRAICGLSVPAQNYAQNTGRPIHDFIRRLTA